MNHFWNVKANIAKKHNEYLRDEKNVGIINNLMFNKFEKLD